jgi:hypothetical protein
MTISAIGLALLAVFGFWIFGGFALRLGGALLVLVGVAGLAMTGDASGLILLALGALLWWVGHLHYALRRRVWKSALAGCIFDSVAKLWTVRWSRPIRLEMSESPCTPTAQSRERARGKRRAGLTRLGRSG